MVEKRKRRKNLKLKPSSREKRRYFLVRESNKKIEKILLEYLGILGFARSAYIEVRDKDVKGYTIGSCLTKSLKDIRTSLALSRISIKKVSGTIKGLKTT